MKKTTIQPCEMTIKATALGIPRAYFTAIISIENAKKITSTTTNDELFTKTLKLLNIDTNVQTITGKQLLSILDYLIRTESINYNKNNIRNEYFSFLNTQPPKKKIKLK